MSIVMLLEVNCDILKTLELSLLHVLEIFSMFSVLLTIVNCQFLVSEWRFNYLFKPDLLIFHSPKKKPELFIEHRLHHFHIFFSKACHDQLD